MISELSTLNTAKPKAQTTLVESGFIVGLRCHHSPTLPRQFFIRNMFVTQKHALVASRYEYIYIGNSVEDMGIERDYITLDWNVLL